MRTLETFCFHFKVFVSTVKSRLCMDAILSNFVDWERKLLVITCCQFVLWFSGALITFFFKQVLVMVDLKTYGRS